jgi:uncharacterized membrane protein
MEGRSEAPQAECTVTVRPNCSLSPALRHFFLCFIASVSFGIALVFAWLGAWMVLPFAGLEVGLLVWAFRELACHADDYEKITISNDRLLVESREAHKFSRHEFDRHWAQVVLISDPSGARQVALRSHGKQVEVGRCLTPDAREALMKELRIRLSN